MSKKLQIVGAISTPQADFNQTDETQNDYIKNKPDLGELAAKDQVEKADLASDVQTSLEKADTAVLHSEQILTDDQKLQVRANIGAASADDIADVEAVLSRKSDSTHNHDTVYETKESAADKLEESKAYTDSKTSNLASTSAVNTSISTHNTSTSAHNDIRDLITALTTKLNAFLDVDDTTADQLSEVLTLIENNKGTLESLTSSKVNVSDIVDNLITNNSGKVLSAAQGVVIKNLIDALQQELTFMSTNVAYINATSNENVENPEIENTSGVIVDSALSIASINPVQNKVVTTKLNELSDSVDDLQGDMGVVSGSLASHTSNTSNPHDVTAAQVGLGNVDNTSDTNKPVSTAQATAIADAKKAGTDAQIDLAAHTGNKSNPHGVTLSQLGVTATATELNYVDGVTSNVQTQLNSKASTNHGNHVPTIQTANNAKFLRNDNTWQTVTPANIGAAASSHTQAASTITAGTFAGQVVANATAIATVGTAQVRNIYAGTSDMTAGSTALATGTLYFVYE